MLKIFFRIILTAIVLLNFCGAFAQNYPETALLFSRTKPGGSARVQAIGGSQIALGGDYSSSLSNPAGLGMFNRSEFTFSAGLSGHTTFANYPIGSTDQKDNRTVFNIPGLSLVWHMPSQREGAFIGGSFAVSMSRINDFNRSTNYSAPNDQSSIIDYFIDDAYGHTTYQFDDPNDRNFNSDSLFFNKFNDPTGLAYFNYLIGPKSIINPDSSTIEYFTDADYPDRQGEQTITKGSNNQWSFSYGANFNDKFFLGGGIGISSIRFKSQKIFSESFPIGPLENLQLGESFEIRGSGLNATVGAIGRPLDFIQVGISYVSPTYYSLSETYEASLDTNWDNFDYYGDGSSNDDTPFLNNESASTDILTSDYSLTTPSKLSAGIALMTKFGFLTGDVEFMNPAKNRYNSSTPGVSYSIENEDIRSIYRPVINYRLGAEYRHDIYRFRAGFGVQDNAYKKALNVVNKITSITGGFGIRKQDFYVDLALIYNTTKPFYYQLYTMSDGSGPVARLKNQSLTGMVTLGFNF